MNLYSDDEIVLNTEVRWEVKEIVLNAWNGLSWIK